MAIALVFLYVGDTVSPSMCDLIRQYLEIRRASRNHRQSGPASQMAGPWFFNSEVSLPRLDSKLRPGRSKEFATVWPSVKTWISTRLVLWRQGRWRYTGSMESKMLVSKLLAIFQLTRAALLFTAVADSCTLVLLQMPGEKTPHHLWLLLSLTGLASACLYAFGMSLNDLLDTRRDRLFAQWRPLPSGRLSQRSAMVIAMLLLMLGLFFGAMVGVVRGEADVPWSFLLCLTTAMLIVFYNATGKYLGAAGLLSLGAVRGLNSMIGFPRSHGLLLPLILFTHVTIISTVAYYLEHKRPRLKVPDFLLVAFGVLGIDALLADLASWQNGFLSCYLSLLIGPLVAAAIYWAYVLATLRIKKISSRAKGARIMLVGLFWLFVLDGSLLAANGQWIAAVAIGGLGALALIAFSLMRRWGRTVTVERLHYRFVRQRG